MKKPPSNDDGGKKPPSNVVDLESLKEIDKKFAEGESILEYMDMASLRRLNPAPRRINVDFPGWMVDALDKEANRLGVTRQSLIKMWLAEKLQAKTPAK